MKNKVYSVYGIVMGTKYLGEYRAKNKKEAIEKALESDNNSFSLCHQCSDEFELDENSCQHAVAEEIKYEDKDEDVEE